MPTDDQSKPNKIITMLEKKFALILAGPYSILQFFSKLDKTIQNQSSDTAGPSMHNLYCYLIDNGSCKPPKLV